MKYFIRVVQFLILPILVGLMIFTAWNSPGAVIALQEDSTPSPLPTLPPPGMAGFDRGILLDLAADASQAEFGWEVYRLICSACHAYDGTGLTGKWLASWDPADQNCWQSKCHARNHPPDGFYLPVAPPVVGGAIPRNYASVQELYDYNLNKMPWHDPGMMTEDEAWAVTAHILRMNGYEVPEELGPDNAAGIDLRAGDSAERAQSIYKTAVGKPVAESMTFVKEATIAPFPTRASPTPPVFPISQTRPRESRTWVLALPVAVVVILIIYGVARRIRNRIK
jgi:hypothetical protein